MKHKITVAAILALLAAAFVWQAFAQTDCRAPCKAAYDACWKEYSKPGADPRIAGAVCGTAYTDCLDACRFAELGTPKTPCEAACKAKFETCLKQKAGACGSEYDLCVYRCK